MITSSHSGSTRSPGTSAPKIGRRGSMQQTMSIRQKIFQNPRVGMAVAGVAVVIGIISISLQMRNRSVPGTVTESFFTVDDGKTWFTDSAANIPPYDKDGKQAVRAFVYRCANGTQFVNHLERFKPEAKTALE